MEPPIAPAAEADRWDAIARAGGAGEELSAWRLQSDAAYARLLERWLPAGRIGAVLKTDLFDESCASGLIPLLEARCERAVGVDVSPEIVTRARERLPGLEAEVADVRALPFADGEFDCVVSNSTLDHFKGPAEVAASLSELARVLALGGSLIITMDNPLNPLIALRQLLPAGMVARVRRVSYGRGWTCRPRRLREMLTVAGFEIRDATAILHAPRLAVARAGSRAIAPDGSPASWVEGAERLERLPTRWLTGHFVAMLAVAGA